MDISTPKKVWDELVATIGDERIPDSTGFGWGLMAATSKSGEIKYGDRPTIRISSIAHTGDSTELRITLIHEMAHYFCWYHLGRVRGHGPVWKATHRRLLNAAGMKDVVVSRTAQRTESSARRIDAAKPYRYFCECPARTLANGGYGSRSRRSLDGRKCAKCGTLSLHIEK